MGYFNHIWLSYFPCFCYKKLEIVSHVTDILGTKKNEFYGKIVCFRILERNRNIAFIALIIYVKSDNIITIDPNVNINKIILIFCYYCDTNLKKNKNNSR